MATTLETTDVQPLTTEGHDASRPNSTSKSRRAPKKTLSDKFSKSALMAMRRVHLYSGIFMFPFVLLYGFSGWFLNHPGYFRDGTSTAFAAADVADGELTDLPNAAVVAKAAVEGMNLESSLIDGPEILLSDEQSPRFSGFYTYTVDADDATHHVYVNPTNGSGKIKTVPVEKKQSINDHPVNPMAAIRSATIPDNPLESVRASVPAVLDDLQLPSGEAVMGHRPPNVVFTVTANDVPCLVTYNLDSGSVTSVRQDARPEMGFKDSLRRMHLARMYTPQVDVRWVWALVVDAMFVSMVFWGFSGLFMWWQVKRTRWLGGGFLIASVVFSFILFAGMHSNLTEGSGRRGGGGRAGAAQPSPNGKVSGANRTVNFPSGSSASRGGK